VRRLGLLGGAFDPPHLGHLILGESARTSLQLDTVIFLPTGEPPHKKGRVVTPATLRLALTRAAIQGNPHFRVETTDLDRPPPHYTATLLPILRDQYPDAELWLLLGGDSLRDLPTWNEPGLILEHCRLGVLPRPGAALDWDDLEQAVPGVKRATQIVQGPSVAIASHAIRQRISEGQSVRYLVPDAALALIESYGLYRLAAA
jgi:nicotinate-nucleotide adenylyltransferase